MNNTAFITLANNNVVGFRPSPAAQLLRKGGIPLKPIPWDYPSIWRNLLALIEDSPMWEPSAIVDPTKLASRLVLGRGAESAIMPILAALGGNGAGRGEGRPLGVNVICSANNNQPAQGWERYPVSGKKARAAMRKADGLFVLGGPRVWSDWWDTIETVFIHRIDETYQDGPETCLFAPPLEDFAQTRLTKVRYSGDPKPYYIERYQRINERAFQ